MGYFYLVAGITASILVYFSKGTTKDFKIGHRSIAVIAYQPEPLYNQISWLSELLWRDS